MLASKPMISAIGGGGQQQDAVGEHQPVAAVVQLAGQVAVPGQDRGQPGEAVERGVRGEDQDGRGGGLEQVEQHRACRRTPRRRSARSPTGRRRAARGRRRATASTVMPPNSTTAMAPHHGQGGRGVAGLGLLERGHAVADRLHPGQRGAAGGERAHQQQHQRQPASPVEVGHRHRLAVDAAGSPPVTALIAAQTNISRVSPTNA